MTGSEIPDDAVNLLVLTDEWEQGIGACAPTLTAATRLLVISYTRPAENYVRYVREHGAAFPDEFVIIETTQDGTFTAPDGVDVHVERPDKLAGVGLKTNELLTQWRDGEEPATVYFDSITSLVQYTDLNGAYRFLHTFTGQVHNAGARGYYNLVSEAHAEATIATLKQLFDTVLEYDPDIKSYQLQQ